MLIYLLSHSFLNKFGNIAEVRYWLIVQGISVKTSFLEQVCNIFGVEAEQKIGLP